MNERLAATAAIVARLQEIGARRLLYGDSHSLGVAVTRADKGIEIELPPDDRARGENIARGLGEARNSTGDQRLNSGGKLQLGRG